MLLLSVSSITSIQVCPRTPEKFCSVLLVQVMVGLRCPTYIRQILFLVDRRACQTGRELHATCLLTAHFVGLLPVVMTPLQPTAEFMDAEEVFQMLQKKNYFNFGKPGSQHSNCDGKEGTVELLKDNPLASSSLGALVSHLCRLKVQRRSAQSRSCHVLVMCFSVILTMCLLLPTV